MWMPKHLHRPMIQPSPQVPAQRPDVNVEKTSKHA